MPAVVPPTLTSQGRSMPLGLRTTVFHVPDLERAKGFYAKAFQTEPYFDEPFYAGFDIGGYELGLDPDPASGTAGAGGSVTYWGVQRIEEALAHFESAGARVVAPIHEVGGGIRVATVADPFGNEIGLIENPHFVLPVDSAAAGGATGSGASAADSGIGRFATALEREHATTLKVLRAFPAAHAHFRPHERSNTALQLAWTFVIEERLMSLALKGESVLGSGFPPPPDSWEKALEAFDTQHAELFTGLDGATDAKLHGAVRFFVGPNEMGDIPTLDFLWFMLSDQIHHRGQLSVYLRMAGGKVPSIYGPSADEPWF